MSSTSSSPKNSKKPQSQKGKKGWLFQWDKNKVLWYYLTALTLLLIYGLFNIDSAVKLIEMLVKAMEFVINGMI